MAMSLRSCFWIAFCGLALYLLNMLMFERNSVDQEGIRSTGERKCACTSRNEEIVVDNKWLAMRNKDRSETSDGYKSVFLFGYMRGGTSLLDSLISQDERAVSWYEPLSSLYGHLYGLLHPRIHTSIVFEADGRTFRNIEKWEMSNIVEFFTNLFSCNLLKLPIEFLSSRFARFTLAITNFVQCYKQNAQYFDNILLEQKVHHEGDCYMNSGISRLCEDSAAARPQSVLNSIKRLCDNFLKYTRELINLKGSTSNVTPEFLSFGILRPTGYRLKSENASVLLELHKCLHNVTKIVHKCSQETQVENLCKKRIRMAKVLRIKMTNMEPLIQALPSMFLVHYVRDPRAMAKSRMLMSGGTPADLDPKQWEQVTQQLCTEMLIDSLEAHRLNQTYPGVIQRFKYEKIILNPEQGLKELYGSFGETYTQEVLQWLLDTMNSKKEGGAFSVKRKNAKQHVDEWRRTLPSDSVKTVNEFPECQEVMKMLGYSP